MGLLNNLRGTKTILIYRSLLKKIYSLSNKNIIQLSNTTYFDRHPLLFKIVKDYFKEKNAIKIFSFGCSKGEECFTLNEYFPNSLIIGVDIRKKNIRIANKNNQSKNISFKSIDILKSTISKKFDLITAFSVFCREPEARLLDNISKIFNFSAFENYIKELDRLLYVNGVFVIENSNYRFSDTSVISKYKTLYSQKTSFPLFNKDGNKISNDVNVGKIFKKLSND